MKVRLGEIAQWTGGRLVGNDAQVSSVSADTRTLAPGALFVALAGDRVDGHDLVDVAREQGAVAALLDHEVASTLAQVVVTDVQHALGLLAGAWRARRDLCCVGITGSNGKTTVKSLVGAILSRHARTYVNPGNRNNEIGLPLSLLAMPEDTEYLVLEMGAGKPGDIAWLAGMAQPAVALVNNVAHAHVERMGSLDGVAQTKGALISALPADGVAIINADDAYASYFAELAANRRIVRFGFSGDAEIRATLPDGPRGGSTPQHFRLHTPHGDIDVALPLQGRHNVANALAACAISHALGVPPTTMRDGLRDVRPVSGRLVRHATAQGAVVIDDSYNANPASFAAAIALLADEPGRRLLVMGDMGELGADARSLHAAVGQCARKGGIDELHAVGGLSRSAVEAFGGGGMHYPDQGSLIAAVQKRLAPGVSVLVKGSRAAAMDRVVSALLGAAATNGEARHAA